jgi:hypothetical protein
MSNSQNTIKYIKHNKVRIKTDKKREEMTNVLLEFFEEIEEKPTGMRGFMVIDDLHDISIFKFFKLFFRYYVHTWY